MIKLLTDSTCDISKEILEKYNIDVFPLIVTLGDEVYFDGENVFPEDIYSYVEKTGQLPTTSARNIYDLKEIFEKYTQNGDEVIYCGIGSKLSSNFSNAISAREEMEHKERVFLVDSCSLSTGISVILIEGAKAITNLKSAKEVVEIMENTAKRLVGSFMVDKLDYLYKGGRVSRFSFSMATFLHIKPRLELKDGLLVNTGKEMGAYKVALKKYVDVMLKNHPNLRRDVCYITHSKTDPELLKIFTEYLKSKNKFDNYVDSDAGSVITSHCGQNTIGFFFLDELED